MKLVPKSVERAFLNAMEPMVDWLVRRRVRPNTITTWGVLLVLISAVAYAVGQIRLGGALLLLSGAVDTLDGQVARRTGQVSPFGAFYDSTLDRVGDGATFIGIAVYFLSAPGVELRIASVVLCMIAVLSSLLVSYARARAEGLGLECTVGLVQRAERLLGIGIPSLLLGAQVGAVMLQVIVGLLAVMSTVTVVQRFVYVYRITGGDGSAGA